MVQQNDSVDYQGRKAKVTSVMGSEPHQVVNIRFDDGSERIVTAGELGGSGGMKPNITPPAPNQDLPSNKPDFGGRPRPTPYRSEGSVVEGRADVVEPPLEGGNPVPPLSGEGDTKPLDPNADTTPNDSGPGTGDTGAGLKADGKDTDSPRRRLLGTEEILVYIEPTTRRVVDRNGRKLEIGTTVSLKARIIGFKDSGKDEAGNKGGIMAEVLYPPYVPEYNIPVIKDDKLWIADQDGNPTREYTDNAFSIKDGSVVDAAGNEPAEVKRMKQEKLVVDVRNVERF